MLEPYVTRQRTNTGHLSNLAAGPLDEFHLVLKVIEDIKRLLTRTLPRQEIMIVTLTA